MNIDTSNLLNSILEELSSLSYVHPGDVPNINLYMDQVTTFMDEQLASTKRYPDDKILTKTMINNYAKNDLLPPPVKKKYSKEHMILLIMIYYYKGILSINDIQTLLNPITEKYFQTASEINLGSIYEEIFRLEEDKVADLQEDIIKKFSMSEKTFQEASGEDQEVLQLFSFICMLSYDVYVKKLLIEKMIDSFRDATTVEEKNVKDSKK